MSIRQKLLKVVALFLVVTGLCLSCPRTAAADLMIAPLRIVFQDRARSAEVTIINTSKHINTYRLGWKMSIMDENGRYKDIELDEKDPHTVPAMVAFSPRQVRIEPGDRQRVRLSLRRPADLPPGEYRAHLVFSRLPPDESRRNGGEEGKGIKLQMNVLLNYSIPVIVRNGADPKDMKISLSQSSFSRVKDSAGRENMGIIVSREAGSYSSFGRIRIYWRPTADAPEQEVGLLNNVALWPENKIRKVDVPINKNLSLPAGAKVRVVYEGQKEYTNTIWDEKVFTVPAAG